MNEVTATNRIADICDKHNIKPQELGDYLRLSRSQITRLRKGQCPINFTQAFMLDLLDAYLAGKTLGWVGEIVKRYFEDARS